MSREGGTARRLTSLGVDVEDVAWQPDSRALVVTADSHQRDEWTYERADLWRVGLDGATTRLSDDGHHHDAPAFTRDGRELVFRRRLGLSSVIASGLGRGAPVDLSAYRGRPIDAAVLREVTDLLMAQVRELLAEVRGEAAPAGFYRRAS